MAFLNSARISLRLGFNVRHKNEHYEELLVGVKAVVIHFHEATIRNVVILSTYITKVLTLAADEYGT